MAPGINDDRHKHPWIIDVATVACLLAVFAVLLTRWVALDADPAEDAAILMRYAQHLAAGQGIVWNIGDPPLDGATDFLFMVLVAAIRRLSDLSVEAVVRLVNVVSMCGLIVVVYATARRFHNASIPVAAVAGAFIVFGSGIHYVEAGFGAPFFGLTAATTWLALMTLRRSPGSKALAMAFAGSALLMGLTRPEGVLLAGYMLLALMVAVGPRRSLVAVSVFVAVFGTLGLVYFLWRWHYFGHPLPNPFYKKGGGQLHLNGLVNAVRTTVEHVLPFLPLYALCLRERRGAQQALFSAIPAGLFVLSWVMMSDEMNFAGRFQYPVAIIVALSWPGLLPFVVDSWRIGPAQDFDRWSRAILVGLALLAVTAAGVVPSKGIRDYSADTGRREVAEALARFQNKGYGLATTEAGLLPLYSGWRTLDTWGLNDALIAREGLIPTDYLAEFRPEVVMFHGFFSPITPFSCPEPPNQEWDQMLFRLRHYAEANDYRLAAAFGVTPYDTHYYYVRRDFADSLAITQAIRSVPYRMAYHSEVAVNFADFNGARSGIRDCGSLDAAAPIGAERTGPQGRARGQLPRGGEVRGHRKLAPPSGSPR